MLENFEIQTMKRKYSVVKPQCQWDSVIEGTTNQTATHTSIYFPSIPCSAISTFQLTVGIINLDKQFSGEIQT